MGKNELDTDENNEETLKKARLYADMLLQRQKKLEERRKKIKQLEENILDMYESAEDNKLKIKAAYVEPRYEPLSTEELSAPISRSLVPDNPYYDVKRIYFHNKEGEYRKIFTHSKEMLQYEMTGSLVPSSSPEAEDQVVRLDVEEMWKEIIAQRNEDMKRRIAERAENIREQRRLKEIGSENMEDVEEEMEEEEEPPEDEPTRKSHQQPVVIPEAMKSMTIELPDPREVALAQKKFMNRFTYSDRSALTYDILTNDKTTQTVPTPRLYLNGNVSLWIINQAYDKDYNTLLEAKEKERIAKMTLNVVKEDKTIKKPPPEEDAIFKRMADGILFLERMLNQNLYDNIAQDCTFYEDPGDKYRTDEGVLLPLWEFSYNEAKNYAVTDLKWNPAYKDMFGVSFGMMDFVEPNNAGYLCMFTLKNPSYPEFVKHLDSGATCLDFHPTKCYYICVGLNDGGVMVFNTQKPHCDTQYRSRVEGSCKTMISSVLWYSADDDGPERRLCFFSAGTDGKIVKWTLLQNELEAVPIITLYVDKHDLTPRIKDVEMTAVPTSFAFHPSNNGTYLVGTNLGTLYKCCTTYTSAYLYQIKAHELPVHRISFNPYITDIFLTSGGDWRIKIWEDGRLEPLFLYNLDNPVGDAQWAPYSSTVLAAITAAGKVYVYDLNMDKYEPICAQYVVCVDDNIATRLHFNPFGLRMPLVLLGDSRGCVTVVKLSPNLRVKPKPPKKTELAVAVDDFTYEVRKLEKILSFVKEPIVLNLPSGDEIRQLVD